MMNRWLSLAGAALSVGLLGACAGEVAGPAGARQPGVLLISGWSGTVPVNADNGGGVTWNRPTESADYSAPQVLVAPDTVLAGVAFEVTTHTVGPNGCWRPDGQTAASYGRRVVLKPYDAHSGSEVCTLALTFLAHSTTLVLEDAGEWTLRVDGRRLRMGDDVWEEPISAERTIIVR